MRPLGDGRFELLSPRLERASSELASLGVPLDVALDVTETLKRHSEAIAKAYVRLFLDHVWRPFQESGEPDERWPEVREALERLRPLAGESLIAVFGLVMTAAVERALERELAKMGREEAASQRRRRRCEALGRRGCRQRLIQPEKKRDAPTAATTVPPQKRAAAASVLAAISAVSAPITNSGRPTSQRQLTMERPGGVRKVRLMPQRSRGMTRS